MDNPYKVLGLNENASPDEIKKAYRELAKKYHPDQYGNNPLKTLAEEKMREINEAYDFLMKKSQNTTYNNSSYGNSSNNADYNSIRNDLNRGDINSAEAKLNRTNLRDAEWFFLMGNVYLRRGYYDNAYNHIQRACDLNPSNPEYMNALQSLRTQNNSYRNPYNSRGYADRDSQLCNLCVSLWCADTLCDCMGGGC
ncbi:curved DNA-binding protein CbpA [Clostridium acetobutylicum]|uniref:Molecular chaperone, DnaJ family (Contain C-term. Zn finger domain) n=1 Tax=Clostridium acetobutylicum (strain ATCC 824 / DSM 792 / JCM 1419 / IAM 19013 / LMG 5710 / NBRC 13948 / NRRL B-527 / VKM B-1787 / 2291 / W) TaxID=272562 RepID=Q97LB4_CLOAB|nr:MULTISPECIES: DnaJ domain-containing protein [Clostridium]AAK78625.1 Molecular chaperone, DnaJ family (contain C-term. Zn finger domain) [Clostridium acetobutylicum ATCC 824]ADZ19699.1 Molecular chaperone, DnaJ family (contains C-term Zn finger domain) [Clostridium acetobutylicum EA 2018]AEI31354.1 molecular chaperone [Clostridium acetobutylicum DSM 1731]AWV80348.1 tetratricopeptide repeat protein [Clostridium acetobutylicum]KHD37591.1 molecular chaperone DnaJ [Clostridium acetobutylicum]